MRRRTLRLLVLIALAGMFLYGAVSMADEEVAAVGKPAPDFALRDMNGRVVQLSDYRGKVVMLNFWATWCPPCREEMPAIQRLHEAMGDRVAIIAIDRAEPKEKVAAFLKRYGITFTVVIDPRDDLARRYGITGIPETFFIDRRGVVRYKAVEPLKYEQMREFVRKTDEASDGTGAAIVNDR